MGLLERAPAGDDGGAAALGQELIERQAEAFLAAVRIDRRRRILRLHQRRDAGRPDPLRARLGRILLFPRVEPGG